jgi:tagaturonate reductase
MILNKENLKNIDGKKVTKPTAEILALPEKVIQFGTGILSIRRTNKECLMVAF